MSSTTQLESQTYRAIDDWPSLMELAAVLKKDSMPKRDFTGKVITLVFEHCNVEHRFIDNETVDWEIVDGWDKGRTGADAYEAFEIRDGIYFLNFFKAEKNEAVSLFWKEGDGNVLNIFPQFYEEEGVRRSKSEIFNTLLEGAPAKNPIEQTSALVGKRILYRLNENEWVEHVYFNKETLAWQGVKGVGSGLADVERCKYFSLDEDLIILYSQGSKLTAESVVVIDLKEKKATGRILGWDTKQDSVVHTTFTSAITILNETNYPQL